MKNKTALLACSLLVVTALVAPAAAAPPPEVQDHLRAYSVLPPGQNGFLTVGDVLGGTHPAHSTDQQDLYANLIEDDDVTEDELGEHLKSFRFGPGDTIEREYQPRADVTVYRDDFGVPHVYGETDAAASFGTGYVTAEDRLWQADLIRHVATGRLASLLGEGDGQGFLDNDKITLRDGYTTAELQAIFDGFDESFGAEGGEVQQALEAYVAGINARVDEVLGDPTLVPAEYQGAPIEHWTATDVMAVAIFQLRDLGDWGGAELFHAALWAHLTKKFGSRTGAAAFYDFLIRNDPNSPTTVPVADGAFPSPPSGKLNRKAIAIPDDARALVTQVYGEIRAKRAVSDILGLRGWHSNMLAVHPSRSTTGNALGVGAPQVGYAVPQFFMELDVHSPGFDFRGPAVPGASFLVPLGRGSDYAWSLTSSIADNVDTRMELLCEPGGGAVRRSTTHYMFKGRCRAMDSRDVTIAVKTITGTREEPFNILRTVHGPVSTYTKVDGKLVAVVQERAYWMHELDSIIGLARLNRSSMSSAEEFIAAIEGVTMGFNSSYVGPDGIAYMFGGWYPLRPAGVDGYLPIWGTGRWEWDGMVPASQLPRVVNPEQGWLTNWNNRPSTGWDDGDTSHWGPTHRARLLEDQMASLTEGDGTVTLSDLVDVIRIAATQDARAVYVAPKMIAAAGSPTGDAAEALAAMDGWVADGAHRVDLDDDGLQDYGLAVAAYDEWFDLTIRRIFADELGNDFRQAGVAIADVPEINNGSSFATDFSNYLWNLFDPQGKKRMAMDYCDNIRTDRRESCAFQTKKALSKAIARLKAEQGDDLSSWTKERDTIHFDAVGGMELPDLDWQNRGTWNHVVEVTGSR